MFFIWILNNLKKFKLSDEIIFMYTYSFYFFSIFPISKKINIKKG